jgi:hypothetical protein
LSKVLGAVYREIFLFCIDVVPYFAKSSNILALSASPRKSFATTFPDASRIKVAGIDSTLYCAAIGSSQNFKFET